MIYLFTLLIVVGATAALWWLLTVTQSPRGRALRQLADQLGAEYRQYAALDLDVRQAGFDLVHQSQIRHGRHQLHGLQQQRTFKILDLPTIEQQGILEQTLIILDCQQSHCGDFSLQVRKRRNRSDHFVDEQPTALKDILRQELPAELNGYRVRAAKPHALEIQLLRPLAEWLQQHPDTCIELRHPLLLIYKPATLLEPDSLLYALQQSITLAERIEHHAHNHAE
ncbi:hypothetical protein [Oceanobacter mangrovi]|uniref:hypothetical protein n=1 Tax=Oceanobacter mangrovi TaxID=2862510 RepID=UPI001C8D5A94|nr:hypothetical protein [Oceanobacter mangrovi]